MRRKARLASAVAPGSTTAGISSAVTTIEGWERSGYSTTAAKLAETTAFSDTFRTETRVKQ